MKQRTEKEQQAYDVLQKLPKVQLTAFENREKWGPHAQIDLCIINGSVYILLSGFGDYKSVTVMRKHLEEGELTINDLIPVRTFGKTGGPVWMVSAKVLQRYEEEMKALLRYGHQDVYQDQLAFASSWFERNKDGGELKAYTMTQEEINSAHFNYAERFRLLNEAHDEINKRIAENLKSNNMNIVVGDSNPEQVISNEELTLKELVDRIEAMGWTVTLHRKDETVDNKPSSASICGSNIQVPSWYDEKTYQMLSKELSCFNISGTIIKILNSVNIKTLGQLVAMNKLDLLQIKNFGWKKLTDLDDFLESIGLEFGCDLNKWQEAHKAFLTSK